MCLMLHVGTTVVVWVPCGIEANTCRVLALDTADTFSYSNRGYCLRKLQRLKEAARDYSHAIELSQPSMRLFNNRAYCYAALGEYKQAVADYTSVLKVDPRNTHALHNRCGPVFSASEVLLR
jgi:Flp pilus assembly protein TadD